MSFGGHVLDMINRMKENRSLSEKLRDRHNLALGRLSNAYNKRNRFSEKELTQEEKEAVRKKVRLRMRKLKRINLLKSIISLIITFLLSWVIYEYILKDIL